MPRAPKKPPSAADLPVLTEVPENEVDLPVLTEVPDTESNLPVLTEMLADQMAAAAPGAPDRTASPAKPAAEKKSANKNAPPPAKPAPAKAATPDQAPEASKQASEPQAGHLTDAQVQQIAAYIGPEVEKLLRKKIAARLDALWPQIWQEAEAELPDMIRTIIVESAKRTRK